MFSCINTQGFVGLVYLLQTPIIELCTFCHPLLSLSSVQRCFIQLTHASYVCSYSHMLPTSIAARALPSWAMEESIPVQSPHKVLAPTAALPRGPRNKLSLWLKGICPFLIFKTVAQLLYKKEDCSNSRVLSPYFYQQQLIQLFPFADHRGKRSYPLLL